MVRTLTLVALLTLVAGAALGFFVAEARARGTETTCAPPPRLSPDVVAENMVAMYVKQYGLDEARSQEVRSTLREYNNQIALLYGRFRKEHQTEYEQAARFANKRIAEITGGKK